MPWFTKLKILTVHDPHVTCRSPIIAEPSQQQKAPQSEAFE